MAFHPGASSTSIPNSKERKKKGGGKGGEKIKHTQCQDQIERDKKQLKNIKISF